MKNTAFIKGMFNSKEKVGKFIGASLKTVSEIIWQIKKAIKEGAEGSVRCTFEDKIVMRDIIFCRTWNKVKLPSFYNLVIAYGKQRLLKSHRQVREDRGLPILTKADSDIRVSKGQRR